METFYQNEILEFDKNSIDFLKMQKVKLYFDKVDIGNQTGIVKEIIFADNDNNIPFIIIIESDNNAHLQYGINSINKIDIL